MQLYMSWYIRSFFGFTFSNILYFFKYSCTNIFHRRNRYTFYWQKPWPALCRSGPEMPLIKTSVCEATYVPISCFDLLLLGWVTVHHDNVTSSNFPAQRPVTWSFDVFFYLRLNKLLSKQCWVWWFETPSRLLWRHCNVVPIFVGLMAPYVITQVQMIHP